MRPHVHVIDAHVTIGANRATQLAPDALLGQMGANGVDYALIAPAERFVAVRNREGNALVANAARLSAGRLIPYAVATPWLELEAIEVLEEAARAGAQALKVDPAVQGFDLLDGQLDPLLAFASDRGWPVYVRTGTPPFALPLAVAHLASRFPSINFILGRNGATDFWLDVLPALAVARNLHADTAVTFWDLGLAPIAADPELGPARIVFSSDAPFGAVDLELDNVLALPVGHADRDAILGGNISRLLPSGAITAT
jgi:uncharacterized protein